MPAERLPTKGMNPHQRQALRAAAMVRALRRQRSGPSKDSSIRHESEPVSVRRVNAARDPAVVEKRFAERERREAADTRTEAQKWLGDPPADRSALAAKR